MIVKNKHGTEYIFGGLSWDESDGSWIVNLKTVDDYGTVSLEVPLDTFGRHFTLHLHPDQFGPDDVEVVGVKCNEFGNTLPAHTEAQHLDENDPIHQCPHEEETDGN